jgi:hypothetical protein
MRSSAKGKDVRAEHLDDDFRADPELYADSS